MSFSGEKLYNLLPAIYRIRDQEEDGQPLRQLMEVLAREIGVIEENLHQLYQDQFIETCADWVIPYIGDLIGYRPLSGGVEVTHSRAEVAHTIANRRRKGTAAVLEQLARDVTGQKARVVEFFKILSQTQHMKHLRQGHTYSPDLRNWELLENLNQPFDQCTHTIDMRNMTSNQGKYDIPNIGIYLWRLKTYSLTNVVAAPHDDKSYFFNPLKIATPLFIRPQSVDEMTNLAHPFNVPLPLSRRRLMEDLNKEDPHYFGEGKSLSISIEGEPKTNITVCDLSNWSHPSSHKVAVDPILGRITFDDAPKKDVLVTYHHAFSADVGGGEYDRSSFIPPTSKPSQKVKMDKDLREILNLADASLYEIEDNGTYHAPPEINITDEKHLELRSTNKKRPLITLPDECKIVGGLGSSLTLSGLAMQGGTLVASGSLSHLRLVHCTILPNKEGNSNEEGNMSLLSKIPGLIIEIERCIIGKIEVHKSTQLIIKDSIVDAKDMGKTAISSGVLRIENSTILGKVKAEELPLALNTVFTSLLTVKRRQEGSVRYSFVPHYSKVPSRYHTVNDEATLAFNSTIFGHPQYMQLHEQTAKEIKEGAENGSEMGVFCHLHDTQKKANLKTRIEEYLPLDLKAKIFDAM